MLSAPAYMLSLLGRQWQLLGARFLERYLSDWLVWEPGPWRPGGFLTSSTEVTHQPSATQPARPVGGDALCFELRPLAGASLIVGRSGENDIVVNDLTVSREQFVLQFAHPQWLVLPRAPPLSVDGQPVGPEGVALANAAVITAGGARLTFYRSDRFGERLQAENANPPR